ncbi:hypothetical protein [Actinokineospora alba]|uniref:hypothetical protein n=1 Tax=Actinokineospora alba TaxID=504798 RepID=UPI001060873A|nr:hypothetical protein [Actinokineospora alba]
MLSTRLKAFGVAVAAGASLLTTLVIATPASAAPPPAESVTTATAAGTIVGMQNCDGRWEEFTIAPAGDLIHRYQVSPGGGWSSWSSLGGWLMYSVDVARNTNCTLEVFGIGGGDQMYHIWQQAGGPGGWSGWHGLGGRLITAPNADILWDGRIEVCAWGPDYIYHCRAQTAPSSGPWTDWY